MPTYDLGPLIRKFEEFFDSQYKEQLEKLAAHYPTSRSLDVDYAELEKYDVELADELVDKPDEVIEAAQAAIAQMPLPKMPGTVFEPHVRFFNLPARGLLIENIGAQHIDKLISFEGLITKRVEVKPRVRVALYVCKFCDAEYKIPVTNKKLKEPVVCESCKRRSLAIDEERSYFVDLQSAEAQEPLEKLKGGAPASRMRLRMEDDLVNIIVPGDNVEVTGILRITPPMKGKGDTYSTYMEVVHMHKQKREFEEIELTKEEEREILELSRDPKLYDKVIGSIAPALYGYNEVKEGIALQLFGGTPNLVLPGGGPIRNDIHILLIGDPGVGKTRFLQYVKDIAPKGIYVGGKSVSGVGLTASVEKDSEFGEGGWVLKAGALVLASGGIGAIDEFDKIEEEDRAAMHEVMESQSYHPNTHVLLADGREVRIGGFVEGLMAADASHVTVGKDCLILGVKGAPQILTTDFNKIYKTNISQVSKHKAPDRMIRIRLQNGRELVVTPEHPIWVMRDGLSTIPAERLRAGELVPVPKILPIEAHAGSETPDFCRLLGYYITDGGYELNRGRKNGINFSNKDEELIEDFCEIAGHSFGITPYVNERASTGVKMARVISKPVLEHFACMDARLIEKGSLRRIPPQFMSLPNAKIAQMLSAIFEGDGHFSKNTVGLVGANREFVEQVQVLLLRFGINSHIFDDGNVWRLTVNGTSNLRLFREKIGFVSERKNARLEGYLAGEGEREYRTKTDVLPVKYEDIVGLLSGLKMTQHEAAGFVIFEQKKGFHFTRRLLERMISRAEAKIRSLESAREEAEGCKSVAEVVSLRRKLGFSQCDLAREGILSRSMISYFERQGRGAERMRASLLAAIRRALNAKATAERLRMMIESQVSWCAVVEAEEMRNEGTEWVYDVTVEPNRSFVGECAILHNTVSIAKAGIVAQFKAKTSILAAANPEFGRFDQSKSVADQFKILPTLISRFDLLFPIKDVLDASKDQKLAEFMLDSHRSAILGTKPPQPTEIPLIPKELLRKYIGYARKNIKPVLSEQAASKLKSYYEEMRGMSRKGGPVPITPRQLEALIRLSQAAAKIRLSNDVSTADAERAIKLMTFVLRQTAYDSEAQTLDIDMLTGQQKSKVDKFNIVLGIINDMQRNVDAVEVRAVIDAARMQGIDERIVIQLIDDLVTKGEFYKPKHGFVKSVKRFD